MLDIIYLTVCLSGAYPGVPSSRVPAGATGYTTPSQVDEKAGKKRLPLHFQCKQRTKVNIITCLNFDNTCTCTLYVYIAGVILQHFARWLPQRERNCPVCGMFSTQLALLIGTRWLQARACHTSSIVFACHASFMKLVPS